MAVRMMVATEDFTTNIGGVPTFIHKDRTFAADDSEIYLRFAHWFKPAEAHYAPEVEAATAAPGELRGEPAKTEATPAKKGVK